MSVLDRNELKFEFASQVGHLSELIVLPDSPFSGIPHHGVRRQTGVGTQHMQHETPMPKRERRAAGNAIRDVMASIVGEAAALAKLSRPDTGAPFAHWGQHLMRMGPLNQGHRKPASSGDSSAPATDAHLQTSKLSQQQSSQAAGQGSGPRSERACMQKDLLDRREDPACSAKQPAAEGETSRKRRRRASAPFACASAGAEGSPPSPGEWKWPELPKWKPPRLSLALVTL